MTTNEFNQLKYGNVIIEHATGRRLLVLHVKGAPGAITEIGVIESLNISGAAGLDPADLTAEETIVVNGVLQSKTQV